MNLSQPTFKVVFLGESGCGKTSIICRFIDTTFSSTLVPTVGCAARTVAYTYQDRELSLLLWDTAGQELYRSLTPIYYRNSAAAVIVFDITARGTFDQVQGWITELQSIVRDVVMVICGNKTDLDEDRAVGEIEGAALAHSTHCQYVETSAKTGMGLDRLIQTLVRAVIEKKPELIEKRLSHAFAAGEAKGCCSQKVAADQKNRRV
jgi:small GTP-binding protein